MDAEIKEWEVRIVTDHRVQRRTRITITPDQQARLMGITLRVAQGMHPLREEARRLIADIAGAAKPKGGQ